ncbi:MAC/perforin domain-containing protein [Pseudoalteromonas piscicida]|uniref:MACPF domain-containing protein n=1 Tax=Pseudoalteromonas piscicida TaxID=43662 RepID=A0A2A5JV72_PSEO7|nr:MAC/perforin domain-containing protein [Pseudoalteromonas piscicida]PCK33191.1 hypothetical protein CEX98_03240 [Pseudoalteromonas piscicida]
MMTDEITVLPGSESAMTCGVNLPLGTLLLNSVFKEEVSDGMPLTYLEKSYKNIKGTKAVSLNETLYDSTSRLFKTVSDFQNSTKRSYGGKLAFGGLSLGSGIKITNTQRCVQEESRSFAIQNGHLIAYQSERIDTSITNDEFINAYNNLPTQLTSDNFSQFETFFETWGTHYVVKGKFGGFFSMITYIDENDITRENTKKIERDVSIGFEKNTDSASFSSEQAKENIERNSETLKNVSVRYFSLGGGELSNLNTFLSSCRKSPVFMLNDSESSTCEFAPLSTLISDDKRETAFNEALKKYAGLVYMRNGMVGSYTPIDTSLSTQSEHCQFVLSTFSNSAADWIDSNGTISVKTPEQSSIVRSYASISSFTDDKKQFDELGLTSGFTPYRANERYLATSNVKYRGRSNPEQVSAYRFGYPALLGFGDWRDETGTYHDGSEINLTIEQDGFISFALSFHKEFLSSQHRGSVSIVVYVNSDVATATTIFGPKKESGNVLASSCSVPVKTNDTVIAKVIFNESDPTLQKAGINIDWSYIPMISEGIAHLGSPIAQRNGVKVEAVTDGFLSVVLNAQSTGNVSWKADAFCARNPAELMTPEEMRRDPYKALELSLVHAHASQIKTPYPTNTPWASFLLPIPKGNWYLVSADGYDGHKKLDSLPIIQFYPLLAMD